MVLEGLALSLVNSIVGDYVDNVEAHQLQLAIWSGEVVMHGLKLKKTALDKLGLSLDVIDGVCEDLNISIPWSDLRSKPVKVVINNLAILCAKRADRDIEEEMEELQRLKRSKLEAEEGAYKQSLLSASSRSAESSDSFTSHLIAKIIENLQLSIRQVHIRFVNGDVLAGNRLATGIFLDEFSAVTTDSNWKEAFIFEDIAMTRKLLRLSQLSVYWDTVFLPTTGSSANISPTDRFAVKPQQYLLKPVSGIGKFESYKKLEPGIPLQNLSLKFEEFAATLDEQQFKSFNILFRDLSRQTRNFRHQVFRPPGNIRPTIDPKGWFKYAIEATLFDIHNRHSKWTWDHFKRRRDDRLAYIQLYKYIHQFLPSASSPDLTVHQKLARLEASLEYEDVCFYRKQARIQLRQYKTSQPSIPVAASTVGWISGMVFGSAQSTSAQSIGDILSEAQINSLYEAIDYDPNQSLNAPEYPLSAVLFQVEIEINSGSLTLRKTQDFKSQVNGSCQFSPLLSSSLDGIKSKLCFFAKQRIKGVFSIQETLVRDSTSGQLNSLFPDLLRRKETSDSSAFNSLLNLEFDSCPDDKRANVAVSVRLLPLYVVYNPSPLKSIAEFFTVHADAEIVDALTHAAKNTMNEITNQTKTSLIYAIQEHRTLDLRIDIQSPLLIFPEDCSNPATPIIFIDLGHLEAASQLADMQLLESARTGRISSLSRVNSLLYDKFDLKLRDAEIFVARSFQEYLQPSLRTANLMEKVDLIFMLHVSIVPKNRSVTPIIIDGEIPKIFVNVSDQHYRRVSRIISAYYQTFVTVQVPEASAPPTLPSYTPAIQIPLPDIADSKNDDTSDVDDSSFFFDAEEYMDGDSDALDNYTQPIAVNTINLGDSVSVTPVPVTSRSTFRSSDRKFFLMKFKISEFSIKIYKETALSLGTDLALLAIEGFCVEANASSQKTIVSSSLSDARIVDVSLAESSPYRRMVSSDPLQESVDSPFMMLEWNYYAPGNAQINAEDPTPAKNNFRFLLRSLNVALMPENFNFMNLFVSEFSSESGVKNDAVPHDLSNIREDTVSSSKPQSILIGSIHIGKCSFDFGHSSKTVMHAETDDFELEFEQNLDSFSLSAKLLSIQTLLYDARPSFESVRIPFLKSHSPLEVSYTSKESHDAELPFSQECAIKASGLQICYFAPLVWDTYAYFCKFSALFSRQTVSASSSKTVVENHAINVIHWNIEFESPSVECPVSPDLKYSLQICPDRLIVTNDLKGSIFIEFMNVQLLTNMLAHSGDEDRDVSLMSMFQLSITLPSAVTDCLVVETRTSESTFNLTADQYSLLVSVPGILLGTSTPPTVPYPNNHPSLNLVRLPGAHQESSINRKVNTEFIWKASQMQFNLKADLKSPHFGSISFDSLLLKYAGYGESLIEVEIENLQIHRFGVSTMIEAPILSFPESSSRQLYARLNFDVIGNLSVSVFGYSPTINYDWVALRLLIGFFGTPSILTRTTTASTLKVNEGGLRQGTYKYVYDYELSNVRLFIPDPRNSGRSERLLIKCHSLVYTSRFSSVYSIKDLIVGFQEPQFDSPFVPILEHVDFSFSQESIEPGKWEALFDAPAIMIMLTYSDIQLVLGFLSGQAIDDESDKRLISNSDIIIAIKEKMQIRIGGLRVIIIDDTDASSCIPMLDFHVDPWKLSMYNWSSGLIFDTDMSFHVNTFNLRKSRWEPLIEPYSISLSGKRYDSNPNAIAYDVFSRKKLDINLTHDFVQNILSAFQSLQVPIPRNLLNRSKSHSPYLVINNTGYDIQIWSETGSIDRQQIYVKVVKNGAMIPWFFDDFKQRIRKNTVFSNKLCVQVGDQWESARDIPVDREGLTVHYLRPALRNVVHQLICEVVVVQRVKRITFRSALKIRNQSAFPLEIMTVSSQGVRTGGFQLSKAGDSYCVPIESCYYDAFLVRPILPKGYSWSAQKLFWKDLRGETTIRLSCHHATGGAPPMSYFINIDRQFSHVAIGKESYPNFTLSLMAPFEIQNLLPFPMTALIIDKSSNHRESLHLDPGQAVAVHRIDPAHLIGVNLDLPSTNYKQQELAIIKDVEFDTKDISVHLMDSQGRSMYLSIDYAMEGNFERISFISPLILLNKSTLDLMISSTSFGPSFKSSASMNRQAITLPGNLSAGKRDSKVQPIMFSLGNPSTQNMKNRRVWLKSSESGWSQPFNFVMTRSNFRVVLPMASGDLDAHLGISIKEGTALYRGTKVVTLYPRYVIINQLDSPISVADSTLLSRVAVPSNSEGSAFLYVEPGSDLLLCIEDKTHPGHWSTLFNANEVGVTYLKINESESDFPRLIGVNVTLEGSTLRIGIYNEQKWPFLISNLSDFDITFSQAGFDLNHVIKSGKALPYAWDAPGKNRRLLVNILDREREVDLLKIGQLMPLKVRRQEKVEIVSMEVKARGPTIMLLFNVFNSSESSFLHHSSDMLPDDFVTKSVSAPVCLASQIQLHGIGLSLISADAEEILYMTFKDITLTYIETTIDKSFTFAVKWIQMDNQILGTSEPVFVYPTVIPKDEAEEIHPVFLLSYSKKRDISFGVEYYNWFTFLLQELSIDSNESLWYELLKYFAFDASGTFVEQRPLLNVSDLNPQQLSPTASSMNSAAIESIYFEQFLIQPMQFDLSFTRDLLTPATANPNLRQSFVSFIFDVLTMTIGNVHDASIQLKALELQHISADPARLLDLITKFYSEEMMSQVHKILGSADVLGNPVGLFNNVSSGVIDLFYEPFQGFEISKPQDFGIGVAKGAGSFVRKTVFGLSNTLSSITNSVGKGLSVITMDKDFQEKRRLNRVRNRPKHALSGVTTGASTFAKSVASGISGIVSKPVRGAQEEGVGGFFKGLGIGVVGAISKPIVGIFDLASSVTEGIRNTATVTTGNEVDRQRLPRYIGNDRMVRNYDAREAVGQYWLKNLGPKYFKQTYLAHLDLRWKDLAVIISTTNVLMIQMKRLKIEWVVGFSDVQLIRRDGNSLTLIKRGNDVDASQALSIPCPETESATWLLSRLESAFSSYCATFVPKY